MKRSYWIIDTLKNVKTKGSSGVVPMQALNKTQYLNGCIFHQIDGQTYLLAPLSEIGRIYEIALDYFMDDEMLEVLNKLKQKHGYFPIITLNEDE